MAERQAAARLVAVGLLVAAGLLAAGTPAPAGASGDGRWVIFAPLRAGFRVLLPADPVRQRGAAAGESRACQGPTYVAAGDGSAFTMSYCDIDPFARWVVSEAFVLDESRAVILRRRGARELDYREHPRFGAAGRRLEFEVPARDGVPPRTGRAEMFVVEGRCYVMVASWPRHADAQASARFFASLEIEH